MDLTDSVNLYFLIRNNVRLADRNSVWYCAKLLPPSFESLPSEVETNAMDEILTTLNLLPRKLQPTMFYVCSAKGFNEQIQGVSAFSGNGLKNGLPYEKSIVFFFVAGGSGRQVYRAGDQWPL